jgi:hypothetical protein
VGSDAEAEAEAEAAEAGVFCIYDVTILDDTFLGNIEHF